MEHNVQPSKHTPSRRSFLRKGLVVAGAGAIGAGAGVLGTGLLANGSPAFAKAGSGSAAYTKALQVLDGDMSQYIHDNTEDEISHFTFLNAYLASLGADPVNLDKFRTLPSSKATGAQQIGRLTNLMQLTVDTTWWTRYRSRT